VPRFLTYVFCCVGCIGSLSGVGAVGAEPGRLTETLMPGTTQGFVAISNMDTLSEHWNKTQLGHLMADPVMAPFSKDLRRQLDARWSNIHERLGLSLDDMKGLPGRDVCIGLVAPAPGKAALAIVVDVTGKLPNANETLKKATEVQLQRGAKRTELTVEGVPSPVIQFDLPQLEDEKEAAQSTLRGSDKSEAEKTEAAKEKAAPESTPQRQAFYCLMGNLLVVTDNLDVMKGILGRSLDPKKNDNLANHKPFQIVMQRCQKDYDKKIPQIRWFINPLGYAEAARAATPQEKRRKGKSILEVMRNQGLGAVQGVGGFFDFASEGYEMVHRTAIYAPLPYEKSMKMAVLPNRTEFTPPGWVPRDVATYTTLYFDIGNAFKHFGALFDELFGMGETGTWEEVKQSLKEDPNGPRIDLGDDLVKYLGQRVSVVTDYQLPITTTSERLLFVIETTNPKAVAKAIEKLMKNDPTARRRDVNGHVIWEVVEDQTPVPAAPEISFGDVPAVTPVHPLKKKKSKGGDEEEEDKEQRLLPHMAITVWEGNLVIASHIDFLLKVVAPPKKPDQLKGDVDYRLVDGKIKKLEPKDKCLRSFSRTDEEYRPTYELVRQNKMPESESMLARLLNGIFGESKKGSARAQRIDGSKLPDYQIVRRSLGPAGFQATSEPNGWYLKGFTLSKEAQ
jgi:hypothetical protein